MRGAGVRGLSAMPADARDRHHGVAVLRPLLSLPRSVLHAYAQRHGLRWIDDESNDDPRFARNALRHHVLASLDAYFPAYRQGLARSARHAAEAQDLLDELAQVDLETVTVAGTDGGRATLSLSGLRALDARNPRRLVNLLRFWMRERGLHALSNARLDDLLVKLRVASPDRPLHFEHGAHVLRRHRDIVRWEAATAARVASSEYKDAGGIDPVILASLGMLDETDGDGPPSDSLHWSGQPTWPLPDWRGSLAFVPTGAADPLRVSATTLRDAPLVARARQGGERMRLVAGGPSRSLKNLFQQAGVPAWRRDVPLISAAGI